VNLDANRSGQAYALTVITPIAPGAAGDLRGYLDGLRAGPSPLARLPRTHFGRWVIVEDLVPEDERRPAHLDAPQLVFTACFDGERDSWLDELCRDLETEAAAIWGRCAGAPAPPAGAPLRDYLVGHQVTTGFFVAAYPQATVADVRAALEQRERLIAFARRAECMGPAELQRAFLEQVGG
jgi:hypothetical protein